MPSHHHVLISCFRWPVLNSSITKGNVCCREKKFQTKPSLVEPPSPWCVKRLGETLPASFSFFCVQVCLLVGADWQAPLRSEEICSADAFLRKNMHHWQVVVLKRTESLAINLVYQRKDFKRFRKCFVDSSTLLNCELPDFNIKCIFLCFLILAFHLSESHGALQNSPVW